MLILFVVILLSINPAQGRTMKFPDVSKTSFTKNSCSPELDQNDKTVLRVQLPESIEWGEPLPICGFLKSTKYMDITVRILDKNKKDIPGVDSSGIDLDPTLSSFSEAEKLFKKDGYIYFNANALSDRRRPPPGHYIVQFDAYAGMSEVSVPVHIRAEGKKYAFVQTLARLVCEQDALGNYKKYFSKVQESESCSDPAPGAEPKDVDHDGIRKQIEGEGKKLWALYAKTFVQFQNSDIKKWSAEGVPVVSVLEGLIAKSCPKNLDATDSQFQLRVLVSSFANMVP